MTKKTLKKLKDAEEKLIDAIYGIQELLDSTEDAELSSMGDEFSELVIDFIESNDTINLNDIKNFIEESING